jgi:uncharacterized protein (TIGR02271 family)
MRSDVRLGMVAFSSDGERLGKVIACEGNSLVVEKGFFFPKDYLCSERNIREVRGDDVILSLNRAQLETGYTDTGAQQTAPSPRTSAGTRQDMRVPLKEEQIDVQKRAKQGGEVRVVKDVVTERKHLDVPVTREEVHVERVPASGATAAAPAGSRFERETVRVPVTEEEVTVTKRPVVKEEVRLSKESHTEHRDVDETVRREKARVERDTGRPTLHAGPDSDRDR